MLGEEAYADDAGLMPRFRAAEHAFTVDPVDGTKNFVHGSADHAVMVAEVATGDRPRLDLAARARGGVGGRARCRRTPQRRAGPSYARRGQPQGATSIWSRRGRHPEGLPELTGSWICCGVDYPS